MGTIIPLSVSAQGQLVNGNFATGDLTGWTLFNTPNGGTSTAQVVQFDAAGTGVPTYSAEFQVGQTSGDLGGGPDQGAGIYQDVALGSGQLSISLYIAATSQDNNGDAGTFELLLDGNVVDSDALGGINIYQTIRSALSYSGTVSNGTYQIAIEMLRDYSPAPDTPYQYLSDVQLSVTPVPEPSACALASLSTAAFWLWRRRKSGE